MQKSARRERRAQRMQKTDASYKLQATGWLSGPVLRDTARLSQRYPPIVRYGVFGVSTWPIGCDTPSPFSECFPLGEHAKWRCDTPPPSKGDLSDTCAIPYENKANGYETPLCDTISKGYCAIWGGISHWAAKPVGNNKVGNSQKVRCCGISLPLDPCHLQGCVAICDLDLPCPLSSAAGCNVENGVARMRCFFVWNSVAKEEVWSTDV